MIISHGWAMPFGPGISYLEEYRYRGNRYTLSTYQLMEVSGSASLSNYEGRGEEAGVWALTRARRLRGSKERRIQVEWQSHSRVQGGGEALSASGLTISRAFSRGMLGRDIATSGMVAGCEKKCRIRRERICAVETEEKHESGFGGFS